MKYTSFLFTLLSIGVCAESFCVFDFKVYYNLGVYSLGDFSSPFSWGCLDSYVINTDPTKPLSISLSEISLNCATNNLEIIDSNNVVFNFCGSGQPQTYKFMSQNAYWIRLRKKKVCSSFWCTAPMSFKFDVRHEMPVTSTNQCGMPAIKPRQSQVKIVGGTAAIPNSWPWQVYLTDGPYSCGASIIDNEWLITAAHCFTGNNTIYAYLGYHNIGINNEGSTVIEVSKSIPHPNYIVGGSLNDIRLLKLSYPVVFNDVISPICAPEGRNANVGDSLKVTGWGLLNENDQNTPSELQEVAVTVNENSACTSPFGLIPLESGQMCAGQFSPAQDACQGDSGGPLVKLDPSTNKYWLVGIVSEGVGCVGHGIYTKASEYEAWVKQVVSTN